MQFVKRSVNVFFVFLIAISISCNPKKRVAIEDAEISSYKIESKENQLNRIVNELARLTCLEGEYVGFESRKSNQRNYEEAFSRLADTTDLLTLTAHEKPVVRVIAFTVLHKKGFSRVKEIFKDHLTDCETFNLFAGCLVTPEPVNISMYYVISESLTPKEQGLFKSKIKEELKKSGFMGSGFL